MKITLNTEEIEQILIEFITDKCAALSGMIQSDSHEWTVHSVVKEGLDPKVEEVTDVFFSVEYL